MTALRVRPRCLVLALLALAAAAGPAHAQQAKRYAFLVGVQKYQDPKLSPLSFCENDVQGLSKALSKAGYEVVLLSDIAAAQDPARAPTRANIEKYLKAVLEKSRRPDTVVLAFAGHGMQFSGKRECYFCPQDAKVTDPDPSSLISLNLVYEQLERSFAGVKILLVDACRDDPKADRGSRGIDADSAPSPPRGVAALFSCSAGEKAFEVQQFQHGIFFHFLLDGLSGKARNVDNEVTMNSLAEYVSTKVSRNVPTLIGEGAKQSPNLKVDWSGPSPVLVTITALPDTPKPPEEKPVPKRDVPPVEQQPVIVVDPLPKKDRVVPAPNEQRIEGEITANDPRDRSRNQPSKAYPMDLAAGRAYQIDLTSKDFDTFLRVEDANGREVAYDDDGGEGLNSRLVFTPTRTGQYRLIATSYQGGTGRFLFVVVAKGGGQGAAVAANPANANPINYDGALTLNDPQDAVRHHPCRVYNLNLDANSGYQIDLRSSEFDSYLRVEDADGKELAHDDDSGGYPNARLQFSPPRTGQYRVIVTSYSGGAGRYQLSLTPKRAAERVFDIEGELAHSDSPDRIRNHPSKVYSCRLAAGKTYQIDLTSTDFDTFLRLEDANGNELAFDDDSGGSLNARLVYTARQTGDFRIVATSFSGGVGRFQLLVTVP